MYATKDQSHRKLEHEKLIARHLTSAWNGALLAAKQEDNHEEAL